MNDPPYPPSLVQTVQVVSLDYRQAALPAIVAEV